jgi:hypothetical protein
VRVQITGCVISSNTAAGGVGYRIDPPFVAAAAGDALGGAIASAGGSLSIAASTINSNIASSPAGGSRETKAAGGAVDLVSTAAMISDSTLWGNEAVGGSTSSVFDGALPTQAIGGAIRSTGGSINIVRSELLENFASGGSAGFGGGAAALGGAIFSDGPISIFFATIASNIAQGGPALGAGGAWHSSVSGSASESLFVGNIARGGEAMNAALAVPSGPALGGAIHNGGVFALTNCTLTLNRAISGTTNWGTEPPFAAGGAIYNFTNHSLQALNVTLASNLVESLSRSGLPGQTLGANLANDGGTITLRNTILAYPIGTNSNVHGPITDGGHNISSDASANFNSGTSFNFTDPRLEALADNGGPTLTMAPRFDSPAIDFGATAGAPMIDQRGVARPFGNGVDIGAVEWSQRATPALVLTMNEPHLRLSFEAAADTSYDLQSSTNLTEWTTLETISASESSATTTREFEPAGEQRFFRLVVRE